LQIAKFCKVFGLFGGNSHKSHNNLKNLQNQKSKCHMQVGQPGFESRSGSPFTAAHLMCTLVTLTDVNNHYAVDPRYGLSLNDSIQMFDEPIQIEPFDHEIPEFNLLSEMARTSV